MCRNSYRWPVRVVACLHLVVVVVPLLIIPFNFLLASVLLGRTSKESSEGTILAITFCFTSVGLCIEFYISLVLIIRSTRNDVDREEALRKCKMWLVTCITLLVSFSGSLFITSVQYNFMGLAMAGIVNVVLRGAFICVVLVYVRELQRGIVLDNNAELHELDMVYAHGLGNNETN